MIKKGDKVKVIKSDFLFGWDTRIKIGACYEVCSIDTICEEPASRIIIIPGRYGPFCWWLPNTCLEKCPVVGEQLLFSFMKEE